MNEILCETEKAWRDTVLDLCDDGSFDDLCTFYGWPRPEWIPIKQWRKAVKVVNYGPKGTFATLRAFCQAALSHYQIPFSYTRFVKETNTSKLGFNSINPQKPDQNYALTSTFITSDPDSPNKDDRQKYELGMDDGTGTNVITFVPDAMPEATKEAFLKYSSNIHRDVLLRGNDGNYRVHRILYENTTKYNWHWLLARGSTAYWRGFPQHTWWPNANHKPFKKQSSEKTEPTPYSDGNTDVGLFSENISDEQGYLLPFTFTELTAGVYKGWNNDWPSYEDDGKTYSKPNKTQKNFTQNCTVKLHVFFNIPGSGDVPPHYIIGANVESDRGTFLSQPFYKPDYYARVLIPLPPNWDHPTDPEPSPEPSYMYTDDNGVLLDGYYPGGWDSRRILAPYNNKPTHYWYYKPAGPRKSNLQHAISIDGYLNPGAAKTPGGERQNAVDGVSPGQEFGGQLLSSDLTEGTPFSSDGSVGKSGQTINQLNGPHPLYLQGGENILVMTAFMLAMSKLLPVGVTFEIVQAYGPEYDRYYNPTINTQTLHGHNLSPDAGVGTDVPIWNNPDVTFDDDYND